ncbi:MAG: hypothetical protein HPY66_1860 [Firmicutes bacterium]|nr:hypothetical protein [Bacillota bacterium]
MFKRILAALLIITFIVSYIPPDLVAKAADPPEINVVYLKTERDTTGVVTLRYEIHGMNFSNPKVYIGGVEILPSYYNTSMILIRRTSGVDDGIFLEGMKNIVVQNQDGESVSTAFNVVAPPYVTSVNKSKVYVGDPLEINGIGFDENLTAIYIAGKQYTVGPELSGAEAIVYPSQGKIVIDEVKAPAIYGASEVRVAKNAGAGTGTPPEEAIQGILKDSISVVGKLTDIEVISLEPDSGPIGGGTIIRMMGNKAAGKSNFNSSMKVYIGGAQASDVQVITNDIGEVIGLQAKTPPGTPGPREVIITDADGHNEYVVPFTFTYLQTGNMLVVTGISPSYAKETEQKEITVSGRNIATINISELQNVTFVNDDGYDPISNEYTLTYSGEYNGNEVTITRKIKLTVGGIAPITQIPKIEINGDQIKATTPIITLDPQVPMKVDVVVNTETIVTGEGGEVLHRTEEYTLRNAFTYHPAQTIPDIHSITPDRGPYNEDIYITINGANFQVLVEEDAGGEVTRYPTIIIGNKVIDPNSYPETYSVRVYDSDGHLVDGKKYTIGTEIRTIIPAAPNGTLGFVDVSVINPDTGSKTVSNFFEFKNPQRPEGEKPRIDRLEPNKGTTGGGTEVVIYGRNFDYDIGGTRVIVTIDGAKAAVTKVKSTGDQITILTPPGTEGYKTVQVINEDGSMAELENGFLYTKINSAPVIDSIAPDFGGAGTSVIIRGSDFRPPDPESSLPEKKLGTRVLLNGQDIDDYTIDEGGNIIFEPGGDRTEVIDEYTIKIKIPPGLPIGPKDVTVVNPDTASYTVKNGFYYKSPASHPEITGIVPPEGSVAGGTVVTISGSDFREGIRVFFGGIEATNVTVSGNGDEIQATTPRYSIGTPGADRESVDVTVVNYDGGSYTEENGFTYRIPGSEPIITMIDPNWGSTAGEETVIIWGLDFRLEYDEYGLPVGFPEVYFGGVKAVSVRWDNYNRLTVITPVYPNAGKVDVTVANPDAGTYTAKNAFEYKRSSPKITSVTPNKGNKTGNEEITIKGSGFMKGDLSARYEGEQVNRHTTPQDPIIDLLVIFGDDKDSAPISGGRSEVVVGNIRVVYDSTDPLEDNTTLFYIPPSGPEVPVSSYKIALGTYHLFIINGPADLGDNTIVDEGIMVEVTQNRLTVTRRVAPYARWIDSGTLVVKTPPVPYIGERNLYVINKDGGTAAAKFEYLNPDSDPQITDIRPNKEVYDDEGTLVKYLTEASVDSETFITIEGSDFRTGVKVFVDDKECEIISKSNDDDMIIAKVPRGTSEDIDKELRIVVVNRDGGTADSSLLPVPRWFVYRRPGSQPVIDYIDPDKTSAAGGNVLTIYGYDFRSGAKVIIGGKEAVNTNINAWSYKQIFVLSPQGLTAGTCDVQVINDDLGTATLKNGITIISNPDIEYVTNEGGTVISSISFLGGETIILKGTSFRPGAKVVFGGEIMLLSDAPTVQGMEGIDSRDRKIKVVGGKEATGVEVTDENTIKLKTPSGVEGDTAIIVINSDGGISDVFDMKYTLPLPTRPDSLDVSLVYDRYVRLEWPGVDNALYYEIYASEDTRDDFKFLTSTTRNVYYVVDLDPDTRYYFKVKAINQFGSSEFTSYRSIRTEDTGEPDLDGSINDTEKVVLNQNAVSVNIGEDAAARGSYYTYTIDLKDPSYGSVEKKHINMPLKVIREATRTFLVDAGEIMLQFSPRTLYIRALWGITTSQQDNVYARLILDVSPKSEGDRALKYLPAKHRVVSKLYCIGIAVQNGKKLEEHNEINGSMDIQIKYDYSKLNGLDETRLAIYRFDPLELKWEPVEAAGVHTNIDFAYGRTSRPGIFAVIGKQ